MRVGIDACGARGAVKATDLLMCSASEIGSIANRDMQVATVAAGDRNCGEARMLAVTLCSSTVHLCDRVATTSKFRVGPACVRRIGASTLDVALSIRRVIRANFGKCVGILAGERLAPLPAVCRPAVRKSN